MTFNKKMMSILENVLMPNSNNTSSRKSTTTAATKSGIGGLQLYPGDAQKFLKWGSIGFLGFGLYQMAVTLAKRNVNPCVEFKDPVEAMNADPIIRDALIQLQNYRELHPCLFKTSLQNIDQLLFLENALLSQKVHPVKNDKDIAFSHFRVGVNRLQHFQFLVRKEMGNEHGMTVNILVKRIYAQMQKHLLNVLHLCSEFRPENLVARAPLEVGVALRRMEEGRAPENSYARWDELRGKLDKEEQSNERRHRKHRHRSSKSRRHSHRHHRRHSSSSSEEEDREKSPQPQPETTDEPIPQPNTDATPAEQPSDPTTPADAPGSVAQL